VERHRATVLSAVPTVLAALANVPVDADISSLRYCRTGAAPLAPDLAARFKRHTGLHVHESLGMTEMAGISTITPPGLTAPAGCVGLRLPHSQLRIAALDTDGTTGPRVLGAGQRGMVQFKAPNVIPGFVDPRDTANAFTADGWLASGDIGWLDEQGLLHLAGRSKDLIIRGGHNIDPRLIEDVLGAHPAVQLCAAVGAPDAYAGELPVAFATLRPGAAATEAELLAFTAARVDEAPAKPKGVTLLDRMPVTNVGKVYKPELRAMAAAAVVQATAEAACRGLGVPLPAVAVEAERVVLRVARGVDAEALDALRRALDSLPCAVDLQQLN
jgi:fatty-acyl-CoA synthase